MKDRQTKDRLILNPHREHIQSDVIMADVHISTKDLLQCPVCLDRFERPRSLPCLHTFCTVCLHSHITSVSQSSVMSVFLCPVCRAQTKPPRPYTSRDTWADQFPVNHWILSVLEEAVLKEKDESLVCDQHSEHKLCLFCVDHDAMCCPKCVALSHRKCDNIVDIESVVQTWDIEKAMHDVSQHLSEFENRITELQQEHLLESDCLLKGKQEIRDIFKQKKETLVAHIDMLEQNFLTELNSKCVTLEVELAQTKKLWTNGKDLCEEARESLENIEKDSPLRSFFKLNTIKHKLTDANNASLRIDGFKSHTLHFKMNDSFNQIGDTRSVGDIQIKTTTNTEQSINTEEASNRTMLTDQLGYSETGVAGSLVSSDYTTDTAATDVIEDNTGPSVRHHVGRATIDDSMSEPHGAQRLVTKETYTTTSASNANRGSWITSAVNSNNKITILCDGKSHSLKLFRDRKVLYEDTRKTSPWCAAKICDTFLAVTYPQEQFVRVFEIRCKAAALVLFGTPTFFGSPVRLSREIPTQKYCYGACYSGELLYVACESCLNMYTLDGRLQQSFDNNDSEHGPFLRVVSAVIDRAKAVCYAIDEARDTVYAFKMDSRHLIRDSSPKFVYKHDSLRGPQDMAIGLGGELYVTGFVSKTVHVISPAGETSRVLCAPEQPWAVLIDARRRSLILSFYPKQNVRENVHVYSLIE